MICQVDGLHFVPEGCWLTKSNEHQIMLVIIPLPVVAGVRDALRDSPLLLWPFLQSVISQVHCVVPVRMGVTLGPNPIILAPPHIPESRSPALLP